MVISCGLTKTHLILVLVLVCVIVSVRSGVRCSSFKTGKSNQLINKAPAVGHLIMMINSLDSQTQHNNPKSMRMNEQRNYSTGYNQHHHSTSEHQMLAINQDDFQPLKFQKIMNPKKPHKYPTRLLLRPYDIDFSTKNIIRLRKPLKKHFYLIKSDRYDDKDNSPTTKPPIKLIRTQHNPLGTRQVSSSEVRDEHEQFEAPTQGPQFVDSAYKFKYSTVLPLSLTTEEFMELISSAHSPVRLLNALRSSNPAAIKSKPSPVSFKKEEPPPNADTNNSSLHYMNSMNSSHVNVSMLTNQTIPDGSVVSNALTIFDDDNQQHQPDIYSLKGFNSTDQKELAPVSKNLTTTQSVSRNETAQLVSTQKTGSTFPADAKANASNYASAEILFDDEDEQLLDPDFTTQLTPKRGTVSDKKPVSLVRYPAHKRTTTRPAASVVVMSSHQVKPKQQHQQTLYPQYMQSQHSARPHQPVRPQFQHFSHRYPATRSPQQSLVGGFDGAIPSRQQQSSQPYSVKLISKQKHKYDDKIFSPTLTVVDNDAIRLPPNTTSVHNNKLIVAIRPGRRRRPHPSTTQFPVYNIVAGITPPYLANPTVQPIRPWNAGPGSVYGLLKPNVTSSSSNGSDGESSSSFGASHIRFPAAEPSYLRPEVADPIPSRFNFTLSHLGSSGIDSNKLPDKIILDANEQYLRPPDVVVTSNSTIVARPSDADTTTNQDGMMKLKTTRRPLKGNGYNTTPRVSIISANTTIVAGDSEQLHDVMSNVIAGSHHNSHFISANHHNTHRPTDTRPSLFSYIAGMFNNGITTTILGVLTLMKTVFVALLVMFLPPMALATAIMQVINIG